MQYQFEELAKAFARGVSRRQALRRFVLGLVGVAVASGVSTRPSEARTVGPANSGVYDPPAINQIPGLRDHAPVVPPPFLVQVNRT